MVPRRIGPVWSRARHGAGMQRPVRSPRLEGSSPCASVRGVVSCLRLSRRFAIRCLVLAAAVWPGLPAAAARAQDVPPLRSETVPLFTADVVTSMDEAGRPRLSVSIAVAYGELQWVRVARGQAAGAELSVAFSPGGGRREYGDVWERRLAVASFGATNSTVKALVERRTFDVPPGRYVMRIRVRDLNSGVASSVSSGVTVPDFNAIPFGLAGFELGTLDGRGDFHGTPTRRFGREVERLAARVVLFDHRPGTWPRDYALRYRILDQTDSPVVEGERRLTVERSGAPVVVRPDSSTLFIGPYVFEVGITGGKSRARIERSFEVEESGPPRRRELERLLEPLALMVEGDAVDSLRDLPPERRPQAWEAFWRRRDPNPETPRNEALIEFMRRVRYVNLHYREAGPGWRSDRGRVYMRRGTPDQIERRPRGIEGPPMEIWYYERLHVRYVFVDQDGFGRYVLVDGPTE